MNPEVVPGTGVAVPALVAAGLDRTTQAINTVMRVVDRAPRAQAARAERLAALYARRARWWAVLARHTYSAASTVPPVYGRAAMAACGEDEDRARFWTESAADWRARATGVPTSDAAGALCNHHELGIAS